MRFICLGYLDVAAWGMLSAVEQEGFMEACFAYDDELRWGGHFIGGEALQVPENAVTIRSSNGKPVVTDGPFTETKEYLGGILILEARDLNHAIQLMARHPGVRAGGFEIRPSDAVVQGLIAERTAAMKK